MSIEFNHTLVHAKDIWVAAREVGGVLGLPGPASYGPFAVLQFDNGATLDFIEDAGEIKAQHYAFLVQRSGEGRHRPRRDPADVGVVAAAGGEKAQPAIGAVHRRDHRDVGQV